MASQSALYQRQPKGLPATVINRGLPSGSLPVMRGPLGALSFSFLQRMRNWCRHALLQEPVCGGDVLGPYDGPRLPFWSIRRKVNNLIGFCTTCSRN